MLAVGADINDARFEALLSATSDAVCITDRTGAIVEANPAACELLGDELDAIRGLDLVDTLSGGWPRAAERRAGLITLARAIGEGTAAQVGEARFANVRRVAFPASYRLSPIRVSGETVGFVMTIQSQAEILGLRTELNESESRFRAIFTASGVAIARVWLDGEIGECNAVYAELFGYSRDALVGKCVAELVHPDDRALVPVPAERRYVTRTGETIWGSTSTVVVRAESGEPVFEIHLVKDVTKQKQLELELRFAQKLESIGRLAAGVAHEINTPIQFVGDNLGFLQTSFLALLALDAKKSALLHAHVAEPERAAALERLEEAEREADAAYLHEEIPRAIDQSMEGAGQVARIVKALKQFSHPDRGEAYIAIDLNAALESTLTVARNEIKYVADVAFERGELPLVLCLPGELNQVFLNLLVNAAHAIGDRVAGTSERGKIVVRTVAEGETVVVAFNDTGGGIPESIRDKIFDPFFTTKEVGRGTGQGLALARSVVEAKHRGALTFDTQIGVGTTFYVRLPINGVSKEAAE